MDNSPTVPNLQPHFGADLSSSALSPSQRQSLLELLNNYSDLLVSTDGELGRTNMVKHHIRTAGEPIRQPMHRLPEALKTTVDSQVQNMLQNDIIQPSHSPWSSPVVMVEKKDGT